MSAAASRCCIILRGLLVVVVVIVVVIIVVAPCVCATLFLGDFQVLVSLTKSNAANSI